MTSMHGQFDDSLGSQGSQGWQGKGLILRMTHPSCLVAELNFQSEFSQDASTPCPLHICGELSKNHMVRFITTMAPLTSQHQWSTLASFPASLIKLL